jgi:replicative DNA helicase
MMVVSTDRLPPQSLPAEQATLGAMMLERQAISRAASLLEPGHFYRQQHGRLFEVIRGMHEHGLPVDLETLRQRLCDLGELDQMGGMGYLTVLLDAVPTAASVDHYATAVRESWVRREVIALSDRLTAQAHATEEPLADLLIAAQEGLNELAGIRDTDTITVGRAAADVFERLREVQGTGRPLGYRCGLPALDRKLGGFEGGMFVVLAAWTSFGKTAFLLNLLHGIARLERVPVLLMSVEQPTFQLGVKAIAGETAIEPWRLRSANLTETEWVAIASAVDELRKLPNFYLRDSSGMTVERLCQVIRSEAQTRHVKVVGVDFMQLLGTRRRVEGDKARLTEVAHCLRDVARTCNLAIIAASQLSRAAGPARWIEGKDPVAPELSHLKESGDIENAADVVMFIQHETRGDRSKTGRAMLAVAKNRMGESDVAIDLNWEPERQRFTETSEREEPWGDDARRDL